ncbi:MAG: GlsB/YeaQ/YmgE family stress response membrane protein [Pseudomonadota bacterium]
MDPVSQIIVLCIGNVVAWLAAIYGKDALRGLIGNVVISALGAFVGRYLSLRLLPILDRPGMIVAAFVGAIVVLSLARPRIWRGPPSGSSNHA